jgi:FkbM family methyltransferase
MAKQIIAKILDVVLPQSVKNSIFHLGFNLAQDRFREFAYRYALAPNMKLGLSDIAKRGFSPKTIVDVGSYHGDWSVMVKSIWPQANIIMFEANQENESILKSTANRINAQVYFELLGSEDGKQVDFFVMDTGSSVYEENSPLQRTVEKRILRSLDSLLPKDMIIDFLKIDTQGYELEVLGGAPRTLKNAEAILLEVSLLEINKSAPLIDEVLNFLKGYNFRAYEILEIHRRPLDFAMNQVDILFVKEDSPLRANKSHF